MYTIAQLTEIVREMNSKKRFAHSLNVAKEAERLALHYGGVDPKRAYVAGLLHDICKDIPQSEQLEMTRKSTLNVSMIEISSAPLRHSIAGAWYIENNLGIKDMGLLHAVRYHTAARGGMSRLEEIIYLADLISADRTYKDVEKMRKLAYSSINDAMLYALQFSITSTVEKAATIPPCTLDAYNCYALKRARAVKNVKAAKAEKTAKQK